MIQVLSNPTFEEIKEVFFDPHVWNQMEPGVEPNEKDIPIFGWKYLKCVDECGIIAIARYRDSTAILGELHGAVAKRQQGHSEVVIKALCTYLKEHTTYKKIVISVPSTAIHALKFYGKLKFMAEGIIHNAIYYNNEQVSLYLLTKEL